MGAELLPLKLEFDLQDGKGDGVMKNIQQEIECPRCSDLMTLSSEFDKLLYFCHECELSLVME
jgi:hypothetical protein